MTHQPYAVLELSDFRLLIAARLLVSLGSQIQGMAVGWQIYSLTRDPLALGFAGLAEAIPALGIALYAGHIADIADRRIIALFAAATMSASLFGLCGASVFIKDSHTLTIVIYLMVALGGLARGFYGPSLFGLVSQIVPRQLYANASAWTSAVWQGSAILGPIVGGALYVGLGGAITYAGSGFLVLCGFAILVLIKSRSEISPADSRPDAIESIREGLRFVFSHQVVLASMSLDLFAVLFGGAVALLPIFASEIFHRGPAAMGILRAAPSIGALLSASILTHYQIKAGAGYIFLAVVAGFGLCVIGFGASTDFNLTIAILALSGVFDAISVYLRSTIYQLATPDNMKGRVAAVNSMFIGSSNEIGEFESGVMARLMGTVPSVLFGGCMTLLVVAVTALKAPKLRRLNLGNFEKSQL